jgi:hypothetical protein
MEYGVPFSADQRIHCFASLFSNDLKRNAFDLVEHEHVSLFFGQFIERHFQFFPKQAAEVCGFGIIAAVEEEFGPVE